MEKTEIVPSQIRITSQASHKKIHYSVKEDFREKLNWKDSLIGVLFLISIIGINLTCFYTVLIIAGPLIAGLSGIGISGFIAYLIGVLIEK